MRRSPGAPAFALASVLGVGLLQVPGGSRLARADLLPKMPAPSTTAYVRGAREAANASCATCHSVIARDHAGGLHRNAFTDASFQKGYAAEPKAFCRACHAPEAPPDREPDVFAQREGVACVTCHQPDSTGPILATAPQLDGQPGARSPHPVRRVADFGTLACAGCHEFAFPGAPREARGEKDLMQKTVAEHRRSSESGKSCTDCHMPRATGERAGHRFSVRDDAALLRRALDVRAVRRPDSEGSRVVVTLEARGVGHAFPTGDLFRRVLLRMKTPSGTIERPFARSFRTVGAAGETRQVEATDTRLAPRGDVEIVVPAAAPVSFEVVYQRITAIERRPPFAANVESETSLAKGAL